jgi:hypothetical protein
MIPLRLSFGVRRDSGSRLRMARPSMNADRGWELPGIGEGVRRADRARQPFGHRALLHPAFVSCALPPPVRSHEQQGHDDEPTRQHQHHSSFESRIREIARPPLTTCSTRPPAPAPTTTGRRGRAPPSSSFLPCCSFYKRCESHSASFRDPPGDVIHVDDLPAIGALPGGVHLSPRPSPE